MITCLCLIGNFINKMEIKPNSISKRIIYFTVAANIISWAHGELYTAISDMEKLIETHNRVIDDLGAYIDKEEERLTILKRSYNIYKKAQAESMVDIPSYLGNPITAFTLIKRLSIDLMHIAKAVETGIDFLKNLTLSRADLEYPSPEDMTGAILAIMRLQRAYLLEVEDLAEGKLSGVFYSAPLTASDCYELGKALYSEKDFTDAILWMNVALRKYKEEGITYSFDEVEMMDFIAFASYLSGDPKSAYEWSLKIIDMDAQHSRALHNLPLFKRAMEKKEVALKKRRKWVPEVHVEGKNQPENTKTWLSKDFEKNEPLCRGEMKIPREISKRLHCRYLTENHPFLRLAPIKMEYYYREPDVILFHEVMSDDEIECIKNMSRPRLRRATINDYEAKQQVPSNVRISKSGWLRDEESQVIRKISRRIEDLTTLTTDTAESLQIVNYGIGGHYEPHFDFAPKHEIEFENTWFEYNRIATVMFYMSEVAQGGATVFGELGLTVFPVKGAAVFWLNLHPSGEGNLRTRHAACPVLRGSKWVANKWLSQAGQELIMPCNLEYQQQGLEPKILPPLL